MSTQKILCFYYFVDINVVRWSSHIYKKSSFFKFYGSLFLVKTHGRWWSKSDKVRNKSMEWKMSLCKWHTFWMLRWFFYCHIFIYKQKVTSWEKFSPNLTLEAQLVWKISIFQRYWRKYRNAQKEFNFKKYALNEKL